MLAEDVGGGPAVAEDVGGDPVVAQEYDGTPVEAGSSNNCESVINLCENGSPIIEWRNVDINDNSLLAVLCNDGLPVGFVEAGILCVGPQCDSQDDDKCVAVGHHDVAVEREIGLQGLVYDTG